MPADAWLFFFHPASLEDQSADHRNIPEFSPRHFGAVYTSLDIVQAGYPVKIDSYTLVSSTGMG